MSDTEPMGPTLRSKLRWALQAHQPASLRTVNAQGERTDVAVRQTKRGPRYAHTLAALEQLEWVRVELLDDKQRLLHVVSNDGVAETVETVGAGVGAAPREQALLALMLRAQDTALQRHTEALRPMMQAMQTVLAAVTEQAVMWRRESGSQVRAQADLASQLAELAERLQQLQLGAGGQGGEGELGQLLQLLPLVSNLGGGTAAPSPGGAPRPPAQGRRPTPSNGATAAAAPTPKPEGPAS